jgi:hypothetical protein
LAARHISISPCDFSLALKIGDERRRQRAFAEQPPKKIGDRKRKLKHAGHAAVGHEAGINNFAHQAEHAAQQGGGGHRARGFQHF